VAVALKPLAEVFAAEEYLRRQMVALKCMTAMDLSNSTLNAVQQSLRRIYMKVPGTHARKTLLAVVASFGLAAATPQALADTPSESPAYGMGPGMMGGYGPGMMGGPGYGRGYAPGYGMGGGTGRGYGPGYYGMGPGMMGGYGMGPWMMGGYGMGYGMGPGMMGGYGMGYGMGPGMMGGCGGYGYNALNLSDAQRTKIQKIQEEASRSQWEIMNKMHEAMSQGWQDAQKKIDAVLTKEQREQLNRGWRGR